MDFTNTPSIDSLIKELGNCGMFQILMVLVVHGSVLSSEWSTNFMAFGLYNPGWTCMDGLVNKSLTITNVTVKKDFSGRMAGTNRWQNESHETTASCGVYDNCENVVYSQDSSTLVTEWDLQCAKSWIPSLILSLQWGGFILGTLGSGVLSNKFGRKATHCWTLVFHAVFNLIAGLSVNWPMFMVMRLLIGLTSGSINVTNYVYTMELVTDRWRAVVTSIPFSSGMAVIFAVIAMVFRDWRLLHMAITVVTVALLVPMIWIPESVRWLAVTGKTEKAVEVVGRISRVNRKKPQNVNVNVIYEIAEHEAREDKNGMKFTILDLHRHGYNIKTIVTTYMTVAAVACSTIVIYGIQSLSGDFYINLILFNVLPSLTLPFIPLLTNSIGRKLTTLITLGLACVCSICIVALDYLSSDLNQGRAPMIFSLLFIMFLYAEWSVVMLFSVELYPTPLRSLSYSYISCIGRIGGMLASFLIPHDESSALLAHIVMAILVVTSFPIAFVLPETKGRNLYDTLIETKSY